MNQFRARERNGLWDDTRSGGFAEDKVYVVQTGSKAIERCVLMTTNPGDLAFLVVRRQRVLLDQDLATLYGETIA